MPDGPRSRRRSPAAGRPARRTGPAPAVPPEPDRRVSPAVWATAGLGLLALGATLCVLAGGGALVGGAVGLALGVALGLVMSQPRVAAAMRSKDGGAGIGAGLLALLLWFGLRSTLGEHAGAYVLVAAGAATATDQGRVWLRLRGAR